MEDVFGPVRASGFLRASVSSLGGRIGCDPAARLPWMSSMLYCFTETMTAKVAPLCESAGANAAGF
jgi:hypothetical protein